MARLVRRVLLFVLVAALLVFGWWGYNNRQLISDHFAAQNFEASAELRSLTAHLALTPAGERVFFATHPTLDPSQNFNEQCSQVDHSEEGHVIGCYTSGGIHLFEVTDERLTGIIEVTAAHELMHAVFARLSDNERSDLAGRLAALYLELQNEHPELTERMQVYSSLTGDAFANELHSVLATEVRELPDWLEAHYKVWFSDRSVVVDYFDASHQVLQQLQDQARALEAEMEALRLSVEQRNAEYSAAVEQFNADVQDFNTRNQNFEFSGDRERFDALYAQLQQRRVQLESDLAAIQHDVARYDEMRATLQQLGQTSQEIDQQLNSELAPPATRPGE